MKATDLLEGRKYLQLIYLIMGQQSKHITYTTPTKKKKYNLKTGQRLRINIKRERHIDGPGFMKKVLSITNHHGDAN